MVSADAVAIWAAVKVSYDEAGLVTLTNIRDRDQTAIDDTVGEDAAQGVLDLWPIHAQVAYDGANATHVEVAKRATISMLWQRGGSSQQVSKVEWDEVFGDNGLIGRIRKTDPRAHGGPVSSSGVRASSDLDANGGPTRPWSDPANLPVGFRSRPRSAYGSE